MIHIRIDPYMDNGQRKFACGIGPELPNGDKWVGDGESGLHHMVDCPECAKGVRQLGTLISALSGRPGHPGYEKFVEIAKSWGYE